MLIEAFLATEASKSDRILSKARLRASIVRPCNVDKTLVWLVMVVNGTVANVSMLLRWEGR